MSLIIWKLCDGNRGHEKQLDGLLEGLSALQPIRVFPIDCRYSSAEKWREWLGNCFPRGIALPEPDLIVGAGHRTHLPLLTARNRFGGRAVVLMRPSLPTSWFNCAIIPQHDQPSVTDNVITSCGVLAPSSAPINSNTNCGLILLGGENKYFHWNRDLLQQQIRELCTSQPELNWIITNSRRTPANCGEKIAAQIGNSRFVPWREAANNWLAGAISGARQIWVTPDSASMLSEALNSPAPVGILHLPARRQHNKLLFNINRLSESNQVTPFPVWRLRGFSGSQRAPLNEHLRCARILLERMATESSRELAAA